MKIEEVKVEVKKVFKSKVLKAIICCLGFVIVASFIFKAGVFVGFQKASFGRNWGDNYSRNFGMMPRGPRSMMEDFDNLPNPHGAIGKIVKIDASSVVVVDDKDKTEKVILINSDTKIFKMRESIVKDNLVVGDFVIVIGDPNKDGQIEAKLIRLMPAPADAGMIGQQGSNLIN